MIVGQKKFLPGLASLILFALSCTGFARDAEPVVQGKWFMELRVREVPGLVLKQRDITIFVGAREADGTYRVLTHFTTDAVSEIEGAVGRPECAGKKECTYDGGSEGIGTLRGNKFYVDWLDEGWIDDVFTITGDRMYGDDGNGPLDFTRLD